MCMWFCHTITRNDTFNSACCWRGKWCTSCLWCWFLSVLACNVQTGSGQVWYWVWTIAGDPWLVICRLIHASLQLHGYIKMLVAGEEINFICCSLSHNKSLRDCQPPSDCHLEFCQKHISCRKDYKYCIARHGEDILSHSQAPSY